ncbi:Glucan endo-1,3-beta-D-glucosidase [Platanthera guangdongensis]|uniref:Glucan endo-1,3-beta-D-glucosidase n=1 Tax=Platanthera guangdongensis TaxID=2320717 RepID=A0ABR2MTE6_9ASPA
MLSPNLRPPSSGEDLFPSREGSNSSRPSCVLAALIGPHFHHSSPSRRPFPVCRRPRWAAPPLVGGAVIFLAREEEDLQNNIQFACSKIDCGLIQSGGPCFDPQTSISHASIVMNLYYQSAGRNSWNCRVSFLDRLAGRTSPTHLGTWTGLRKIFG